MNKSIWLISIILIVLVAVFGKIKSIPKDISGDILYIMVLSLSISVVIAVLRFLPKLEK
jgi:asparagine N-glycosylation enzyme membrane subunit Stt3